MDLLKSRGFSGIWLIGIWQRSRASSKIKDATGNFGTIGSAYSIFDYSISPTIGGKAAFNRFKQRMLDRGLKIGADIVANHTGLFSKWIVDHPDWFIQTKELPFPNYTFTKENLSDDPKIDLYLEDRYYDASDAAVVFKRVDTKTRDVTYVYHGNDGTNLPWNDTAQLDFLNADLREALIETIVDIAQHVDIIRFDAAMAIAKKHVQRLWYPKPGEGGDIPSRSFFSLPEKSFDQNMPQEFWRQVVDRINSDAPDTLLMAEAFWLMESYFVRTLGMHRV